MRYIKTINEIFGINKYFRNKNNGESEEKASKIFSYLMSSSNIDIIKIDLPDSLGYKFIMGENTVEVKEVPDKLYDMENGENYFYDSKYKLFIDNEECNSSNKLSKKIYKVVKKLYKSK